MATIAQQLTELVNQKNALAANLTTKGVTASSSETLNTLVPKVLDIQTGGTSKLPQVVDRSVTTITADDLTGVTKIGENAFYDCKSLTSIEIPANVTSIDYGAFYNCSSLTSISIPSSVTSIRTSAFYSCSGLTSIEIPANVTSIDYGAFEDCSGLETVTFGENSKLKIIGNYVFRYCSSLTSISIPSSVTSIGSNAFQYCRSLTSMRIEATTPPTLRNTNAISSATTQIQVPMASVEVYKTATNWSNFADIIVGY